MKKMFVIVIMVFGAAMLSACHSARDGNHNGYEIGAGIFDLDLAFVYFDVPESNPYNRTVKPIYVERLVSSGSNSVEENRSIVINDSSNANVTYYEGGQPDSIVIYTPAQSYYPHNRYFWNW